MTKFSSLATASALASLLLMGVASAQSTAPAKTETTKTEAAKPGAKVAAPTPAEKKARSAVSLECSKQADEKKLHGKERKKFRSECRKAAGEKTT